MRTFSEPHSQRLHVRLTATEIAALDYLAIEWDATRSAVIRSMIVGAALAQLDRTDALDAAETGFDLIDAPIDDVFAGL